jgi:hypothetical protein
MAKHSYAVVYQDIESCGPFWFDLVHIGNDIVQACSAMFEDFDDTFGTTKTCLMAGDSLECDNGMVYFVVDLNHPPKEPSDYEKLSRYYIFHREERQ